MRPTAAASPTTSSGTCPRGCALAVTAVPDLPLMPDGWRIDGARDACGPLPELYRLVMLPFGIPGHDR